MPRKSSIADRLIVISLTLEAAVRSESWQEVDELLSARATLLETAGNLPPKTYDEIAAIDERMLTDLRTRLAAVKVDMRNLSTALRISHPYGRQATYSSVSLAG